MLSNILLRDLCMLCQSLCYMLFNREAILFTKCRKKFKNTFPPPAPAMCQITVLRSSQKSSTFLDAPRDLSLNHNYNFAID